MYRKNPIKFLSNGSCLKLKSNNNTLFNKHCEDSWELLRFEILEQLLAFCSQKLYRNKSQMVNVWRYGQLSTHKSRIKIKTMTSGGGLLYWFKQWSQLELHLSALVMTYVGEYMSKGLGLKVLLLHLGPTIIFRVAMSWMVMSQCPTQLIYRQCSLFVVSTKYFLA